VNKLTTDQIERLKQVDNNFFSFS